MEIQRKLSKWQFVLRHHWVTPMLDWHEISVGLIKFTNFPEQYECFGRHNFKGFYFVVRYWWPIRKLSLFWPIKIERL
jgi:hypothetical protein